MDEKILSELHLEAAGDDVAGAEIAGSVVGVDPDIEWSGVLKMGVMILSPALPFLPGIYTDDAIAALSAAIVPVAEKYDVSAGGVFAKWGPEIGLAIVAGPLVIQTVREVRAMREAQVEPVASSEEKIRSESVEVAA